LFSAQHWLGFSRIERNPTFNYNGQQIITIIIFIIVRIAVAIATGIIVIVNLSTFALLSNLV
jgi:uncharacterized membrane protein